jgi:glycerol-3-phosphate dehydrogenase
MGVIGHRDRPDVTALAMERYDVIVVGGGVFGAMAHLEAARRGLRSVLVERADFGGATSASSLRIVEGGLRCLRDLDLGRSWESASEQRWFFDRLRPLVEPLPCLLPLYRRGRKQAYALRLGLAANTLAAEAARLRDGRLVRLPAGEILDAGATVARFPRVRGDGLEGSVVWHDLKLLCPARVIIEVLRLAARLGGAATNYVAAERLLVQGGKVEGVGVIDTATAERHELEAPVVIDAAGCGLARFFGDVDVPELYYSTAAWNVLVDRPALSTHAIALDDGSTRGRLFATSLRGKLLLGTGYADLGSGPVEDWRTSADAGLDAFLAAANACVPELELERSAVLRVLGGVLPSPWPSSAEPRAGHVVVDYSRRGGPSGLFTIGGAKLTAARATAFRVLKSAARLRAWAQRAARDYPALADNVSDALFGAYVTPGPHERSWKILERIVAEEAVEHLDDLILRRTNLGDDPQHALSIAPSLCMLEQRWLLDRTVELARVAASFPELEHAADADGAAAAPHAFAAGER